MNDNERTDAISDDERSDLYAELGYSLGWDDTDDGTRDLKNGIIDAMLPWLAAHDVGVAAAATRKEREDESAPHYEVIVWADLEIGDAGFDALFDRVADAAHALDEQITCSGGRARGTGVVDA